MGTIGHPELEKEKLLQLYDIGLATDYEEVKRMLLGHIIDI